MYDAVVVGIGGVGSFALRALSKCSGGRFLGLESFHRCHAKGSSHGKSRIYRRAYFENPYYVPWIEQSLSIFKELECEQSVSLLQECGTLLVAPSNTSDTRNQQNQLHPLLEASQRSAVEHGIPTEFFPSDELAQRYPQLNYHNDQDLPMVGLLEPHGGLVRPERAMESALRTAEQSGCVEIMENALVTTMKQVDNTDSGYIALRVRRTLTHNSGGIEEEALEVLTKCVLISAGSWTGHLIPSWAPKLTVTRQLQSWIDVKETSDHPDIFHSNRFPGWFMESPNWHLPLYGIPCDPDAGDYAHWIKVSSHCRNDPVHDLSSNPSQVSRQEYAELQAKATRALAPEAWSKTGGSAPDFVESIPCLYTMSPDGHFIIGTPEIYKKKMNVFAVAGLSGHGFKMTPALGQMMADFATGKSLEAWNLDFCSPSRFGV